MIESRFRRPTPVLLLSPAGQRHEDDVARPGPLPDPLREVVPVHLEQTDVENGHTRPELVRHLESTLAILRSRDLVTQHPQQHGQAFDRIFIVVYDEDAAAPPVGPELGETLRRRGALWRQCREPDREGAALAGAAAVGRYRAAVELHEPLDQGKPDAKPALCPLRRHPRLREHVEDPRQELGADADPAVPYADDRVVALSLGRQPDPAARISVLRGIVEKIGDDSRSE